MFPKGARQFLFGVLTGLLAGGLVLLVNSKPRGDPVTLSPPPSPVPLRVHVAGAVQSPGVYSLQHGSIVSDAIDAAGGLSEKADIEFVNLAAPLEDGQQVQIPSLPDPTVEGEPVTPLAVPGTADGRININDATVAELDLLPGIGPSLAQAIVSFRESHGPFQAVDDLLDVPGIGPSKLALIRDLVVVR